MTRARDYRREAEERWPFLLTFVANYLYQDWAEEIEDLQFDLDLAIDETSLEDRKQVCREWWEWNAEVGSQYDPRRALTDGFGVEFVFDRPDDARKFMNAVYDRVVVSVRREAGKDWKP